jgi:hypothetical protein
VSLRCEYLWFVRGEKYARQAVTSIASVAKADPGACMTVFTDDRDGWPSVTVGAAVNLLQGTQRMSAQRAKAQAVVLAAVNSQADMLVVLDTDTIVLRKPDWPLVDVVLTWRDYERILPTGEKFVGVAEHMPYNAGVYGIRPNSVGIEAAIWLRENMARQDPIRQSWYCDQLAMVDLAGPAPTAGTDIVLKPLYWRPDSPGPTQVFVAKVPGTTWNLTPAEGCDSSEAGILHFKGHSRPLFQFAAEHYGLPFLDEPAA